ncbi:tRNA-dihydrouridine synthase [Lasiodiplodia theobromae]|uniref:tRNA-dihydrouridine(20) synthase (NAD(P)+) n=1 Tax=Lasiodiplodia theobromae TaxID=45133 RepID=A0A5N5DKR6_9PEZI|nr:tRNA-dihydrouridine synthase [Lasiodiplodia theobromae]KAB2578475.1 tRNA-dihydrouridine(20) synthase (NAD(P)+) [Lasiodiplodia theobromae]KAF4538586.1 tRNA-dihydrouridine synthase [Lasiodiplodia theobromae]
MLSALPRVPIPKNGVDYRNKIVLAPMVRSGELPSRLLALHYGADLVWGPETIDKALIGTRRIVNPQTKTIEYRRFANNGQKNHVPDPDQRESVIYRIDPEREKGRLIFQLGTPNPESAVQAASLVAADVAGIDVNSGCPKPFSTHGGMGAALLKDPDRLCAILEALVNEVGRKFEIGISVKIRILDKPEDTKALVSRLVRTGITGLTVHCRTTPMRPRERAIRHQVNMIREVCHDAGVACLINGDVDDYDHGLQLMDEFGVDGAMIATAAEKNSSVFRRKADGGKAPWQEVVKQYVIYTLQIDNRWGNTKYLLSQLIPGKDNAYKKMNKCHCYTELVEALGFDDLLHMAKATDDRLKIPIRTTKAEKRALAREAKAEECDTKKAKVSVPVLAQRGRIPRGTDGAEFAQYYAHEAATRWPCTADAVSLSSLHLVVRAGRDVWGRTDRAQPLALSLTVASRAGFASAAADDALDGGTVHYGHLSKNVLAALNSATATGNEWLSGLDVASRTSEALMATAAEGAVEAARLDVCFPKASTLGTGAGVEWTVFYAPATGDVVGFARQFNERTKKQMCLVSVWVDKVSDAAIDAYDVVEDIMLKTVENTDFETLEALAEKVAHTLFDSFIKTESSGSNLRLRIEKPTAVPLADFPAIEIYRTQAQVLGA